MFIGQYGRGIDECPDEVVLLIFSFGFVQFFEDAFLVAGGQFCDADPALDGGVLCQSVHLVVVGPAVRTHAPCASSHYIAKIIKGIDRQEHGMGVRVNRNNGIMG